MSGLLWSDADAPDAGHEQSDGLTLSCWAPARWPVSPDWQAVLQRFLDSPTGEHLAAFIQRRLAEGARVYPPRPLAALALTPLARVRVVILGQDPYHGAGQAQGLAFSVAKGVKLPPSLRNIFLEISRDAALPGAARASALARRAPPNGSLLSWAQQGVLLLNTCLSVEEAAPGSHAKQGWEVLTDALVDAVARLNHAVVFMLWGAQAQAKRTLIEQAGCGRGHLLLCANHPSPLSAMRAPVPFIGCAHFSRANDFLLMQQQVPVDWR